GPRTAELILSASTLRRMDRRTTFALPRRRAAVSAEPVKQTMSPSRTWSRRSRAEPQRNERAPAGRRPDFTMSSTLLCGGHAVGEAGFTTTGTPESRAGPAFSQKPQAGKLNALMNTAAPRDGTRKCWPTKAPVLESGI